ncbi:sulfite exporter TauE/SafE family protein [Nostoc sp. TCL26-01]|uniref:sulfite exporter TauE/SafE family protein n=1 Tax=Nostoc sp. TCL26-01 TaxID=2576904 RepID=UPI0015BAE85E|nr:sulfite exporter TauE/SafE family protein [Nostoc sp. TCL26-01]QLE57919.1 sulfite exporter TauE/SafE family protein [Nostoc sp. TCL26-01]
MTFAQACVLFPISWVCGALNSVAGGGGIITFPTLILVGLSPISANATSTVISWPGHIVGVAAYRKELQNHLRLSWLLSGVSLVGGILGAILLLYTPTATFDRLVPYLLLVSMLLFTFGNSITTRLQSNPTEVDQANWYHLLKVAFIFFFVAVYGGFYGLGISFLILATLQILGIKQIHEMNALKLLLISCTYGFAVITFVLAGIVAWPQALLMMAGSVTGGYSGAYYARKLDPKWVKRFVTVVGFAMTSYFFFKK